MKLQKSVVRRGHRVRQGRPTTSELWQVEARLLDAARAVFIERGYVASTIDAIVDRAQASKRTIYSRFGDKEGLFEAVVADFISRRFQPAEALARDAAADENLSLRDRLVRIGQTFLEAASSDESIALDTMVSSQARAFPMLAARLQADGHDRAVAIVRDLLHQAGATRAEQAAEAFYALLVVMPMRVDRVQGVVCPIECTAVVDFVVAGAGISIGQARSCPVI